MRSLRASSSKAKDSDEKRQTQGDRQGRQQRPEEAGLPREAGGTVRCGWLEVTGGSLEWAGRSQGTPPPPPRKFLPA